LYKASIRSHLALNWKKYL